MYCNQSKAYRMNKSQLRKHMSQIVKELSSLEKQKQSKVVFEKVVGHPRFKNAKNISIYLSTDNEINTEPILKHALEVEGKRCFIPYIKKSNATNQGKTCVPFESRMIMVELKSMNDYLQLPINNYGIRELKDLDSIEESEIAQFGKINLELVLVPGVVFGFDGRRLGHGKGYYDEFLSNWCKQINEFKAKKREELFYTLGLAFNEQIVDHLLTVDGHDFELDEVLTAADCVVNM